MSRRSIQIGGAATDDVVVSSGLKRDAPNHWDLLAHQLKDHARRENAPMYHWVEQDLDEASREMTERQLAEAKLASPRAQTERKEPGQAP